MPQQTIHSMFTARDAYLVTRRSLRILTFHEERGTS
jgi:hypothetical protein